MKSPKEIVDPDLVENTGPTTDELKDTNISDMPDISDETQETSAPAIIESDEWSTFMSLMLSPKPESESLRSERRKGITCKIDPQLAFTLDECKIGVCHRTEMINNILRAFIMCNIDKLKELRKQRNSLLS